MDIGRLTILAAVTLGIAGGYGLSALAETEPASEEPALPAPVPMALSSGEASRPSAAAPRGGDAFGRIPAIVARVQPAVVSVLVRTPETRAEGSGVVFDGPRGLVVTNNHVVANATTVEVVLAHGERLGARIRAGDALTDLALLEVERGGLTQARFAGDLPRVGELALALGNPLGFENSVAAGIVSGLHRAIPSGGRTPALVDLIQTDAPISPGNSGGALVDGRGNVIGINVAAIPPTQETRAVSIGFAIPGRTVVAVVRQLLQAGTTHHAFLGIEPANLTPEDAEQLELESDEGILVASVSDGGAAARAGLRTGDVVVAFGREPIRIVEDLFGALRRYEPGDEVVLTVLRSGQRLAVAVVLDGRTGS